jgi:hypothetical protein
MIMRKGRKTTESMRSRPGDQPFLQPLAVALVCIVFISLVLVMGLIDLRTLDSTLVNDMENRGVAIIRNVHHAVEYHFQRLVQSQQADLYSETGPAFMGDAFSLRESLVISLVELARRIDSERETGKYGDKQLASFATKENLWLIAFLDEQGNVTEKSRAVHEDLLQFAVPVVEGHEEIQINIFDKFKTGKGLGFIALRLKSGTGTIILALDDEGFRYWSLRVSVQRAIEEVGQGPGISHFIVTDQSGRTMGQSGRVVENREGTGQMESTVGDTAGVMSRKIILGGGAGSMCWKLKCLSVLAPDLPAWPAWVFQERGLIRFSKKNRIACLFIWPFL